MWLAFGIITACYLLFNCLVCCYWSRLKVAIAVIECASTFLTATKRIVFVSIFYFFVNIIGFLFWAFACICVLSLNPVKPVLNVPQGRTVDLDDKGFGLLIFMFVGLLWGLAFLQAKQTFVCMISAAQYYFTSSREKEGGASICAGVWISDIKHMGSIAKGSAIHTIVFLIQVIVNAMVDAAENPKSINCVLKVVGCLLKCCFTCILRMIEFLNLNAYAFMAITGDCYCTSAWSGFILNLKHMVKFYFTQYLASMFIFVGILGLTCLNMGTCYLIMKYGLKDADQLSYIWGPLIVVGVVTFLTALLFMAFFKDAAVALIMCMAVDLELNDGVTKFGPPSFHQKLDEIHGQYV